MSIEQTRQTMSAYGEVLLKRGAYGQFFSDQVTFSMMGYGQRVQGRAAVEQFIRALHETAFDANPQLKGMIIGDGDAALEAEFVGIHIGEFLGVPATGASVQVPYSVFYSLEGDQITGLRAYLPLEVLRQQLQPVEPAAAPA